MAVDPSIPPVNPNPRPSPVSGVAPPVEHQFRPGNKSNGGRPPGASFLAPMLRKLAANPNEHGEGKLAEMAVDAALKALVDGDPKVVAAFLAAMDRTDGPLVKERINTNTHVVQGISLHDRGAPVPIPGANEEQAK